MINYQIRITSAAERDIAHATDYIELALKNPQAADNLLDEVEHQITALTQLPEKFPLVEDELLASWGIRFTLVNNYLAFYVIDHGEQQVNIVRVLYGKSNWVSILKHNFPLA
ncbi:MAG: type II toxin-antitoxin system RelE/ParE family toxin [Suipraeoptans sp.]